MPFAQGAPDHTFLDMSLCISMRLDYSKIGNQSVNEYTFFGIFLTIMINSQKIHCQPRAAAKYALKMGPITGPNRSAVVYTDITAPLRVVGTRSAIVPPALLVQQEAVMPWKNRNATRALRLGARAHPVVNKQYAMFAKQYMIRRP